MIASNEAKVNLALRTLDVTLVRNQDTSDEALATFELFVILAAFVHRASFRGCFVLLCLFTYSIVVLVEIIFAFEVAARLFKEVKVGLEHNEAAVWRLANKLVLLKCERTIFLDTASVLQQVSGVDGLDDLKLSAQLPMPQLMQAILIILVAEIVDADAPTLKQVGRSVRDRRVHTGTPACVVVEYFGYVRVLQVL